MSLLRSYSGSTHDATAVVGDPNVKRLDFKQFSSDRLQNRRQSENQSQEILATVDAHSGALVTILRESSPLSYTLFTNTHQ